MAEPVTVDTTDTRALLQIARRLAASLAAEGEELTPGERIVITRALRHHLDLVAKALLLPDVE